MAGESPPIEGLSEEEIRANKDISIALGHSVYALYQCPDDEIQAFRRSSLTVVAEAVKQRQQCGAASLVLYHHPPSLEASPKLPVGVQRRLRDGNLTLVVRRGRTTTTTTTNNNNNNTSTTFKVSWDMYPDGIIGRALKRLPHHPSPKPSPSSSPSPAPSPSSPTTAGYVLQLAGGNEEFLLAPRPITQYKTIRTLITLGKIPELVLIPKAALHQSLQPHQFLPPSYASPPPSPASSPALPSISLWHPSLEGRLRVHVLRVGMGGDLLVGKEGSRLFMCAGLYHGGEALCGVRESGRCLPRARGGGEEAAGGGEGVGEWGEWLQFDLPTQELPRGAKLCLGLWSERPAQEKKRNRDKGEEVMVGWGNLLLFNHRGRLVHGGVSVPLQPPPKGHEDRLHPLGSTSYRQRGGEGGGAEEEGAGGGGGVVEVEFEQRFSDKEVLFPDDAQMEDYARYVIKLEKGETPDNPMSPTSIAEVAEHDPLTPLPPDAQDRLWQGRAECPKVPDCLPALLKAVRWSSRDQVSQLYLLLSEWSPVSPGVTLELLGAASPDPRVRQMATRQLDRGFTDDAMVLYLLQLVQGLRCDLYLDSPLVSLLLRRALTNAKLGHHLFWHIRAEADDWPDPMRARAILEAYCRGLGAGGLRGLARQVRGVEAMGELAGLVKERPGHPKNKTQFLRAKLKGVEYSVPLQHLPSPLHPPLSLGRLRLGECWVIDSARCPLRLAWERGGGGGGGGGGGRYERLRSALKSSSSSSSSSSFTSSSSSVSSISSSSSSSSVSSISSVSSSSSASYSQFLSAHLVSTRHPPPLIFKSGDDLRQDMLCLQVLTIMSQLWSLEGLDLPLTPYGCQATGRGAGLIEVVDGAETVYDIQRTSKLGAIQVDSTQLYKWIKAKNASQRQLDQAIDNFTRSCAAYCVATFVLGVGDRHNSNIMVNRDGLIFHIDFGHFLGNFKKKFGIPRERVPFVLASDFLLVIAGGTENPKESQEVQRFQHLCGKAYLALRHHYRLLITLFTNLMDTGIPELQSVEDVTYLRQTLAVGQSEEAALQYFQSQFSDAYGGAWTTKLDWFFHWVRHR
ncbi:phosphatidylinositol 4,5-bisphosphate 3-kinase catalytic subunit alpha isoform-like [Eriocheir sinensis]|uniref:phosphatidylinositol 4,5-bisphosphate 3-kinase catalytic subunit alpha isoform-like n=1 Tax=Eriocheir sinensis TaxID=95602 RepID=UPI0021CAD712|nr:phosphatidylinositol 4,5-bisphosphate 3-kinase catalytic subunit alpha isoform-like [Eriocheir sinensis]XP_050732303.1 phosphatidylinositol 4,5-bisphosphate 3-kinase catalytic subunit alpha isoform-like [Eriocheir sinensis]